MKLMDYKELRSSNHISMRYFSSNGIFIEISLLAGSRDLFVSEDVVVYGEYTRQAVSAVRIFNIPNQIQRVIGTHGMVN